MHSTEKVDHRPESPLSDSQVNQIVSKWDDDLDSPVPAEYMAKKEWNWNWPLWIRPVQRLTVSQAVAAQTYINAITRRDYPYQVREYMGRHLWLEFCEYYAINPDFRKALSYL